MLDDSHKKAEQEFDHMQVRESVVAEKSMFKGNTSIADLVENDARLLK